MTLPGVSNNQQIEEDLHDLPDKVADALVEWRKASLNREKIEGLLYVKLKGEDKERSTTEIRALIHSDNIRYESVLKEITAESDYERLYERLMSSKKLADLRTAY